MEKKMKQKLTETHPAIENEVYEETMNCLRSKLILKCRHIISNDEKNISVFKEKYKRFYSDQRSSLWL